MDDGENENSNQTSDGFNIRDIQKLFKKKKLKGRKPNEL